MHLGNVIPFPLKSNPTSFNALGKMSFKHNSNWIVSVICHAPSQLVNENSPFYFLDGKSKAYATRESTLLEVYIKDKATLRNSKLSCKRKTGHIVESWQWLFQKSEDKRELFLIFVCHKKNSRTFVIGKPYLVRNVIARRVLAYYTTRQLTPFRVWKVARGLYTKWACVGGSPDILKAFTQR